jgi:hypothetical protein
MGVYGIGLECRQNGYHPAASWTRFACVHWNSKCKLGNWKLAEDLPENLTATHSAQPPVVLNACNLCCNERENACAWKDAPGVTKRTAGLRAARADAIFAAGHNGAAC